MVSVEHYHNPCFETATITTHVSSGTITLLRPGEIISCDGYTDLQTGEGITESVDNDDLCDIQVVEGNVDCDPVKIEMKKGDNPSSEMLTTGSPCLVHRTIDRNIEAELQEAMSMRVNSQGSYNVQASEMAHFPADRTPKVITCIVHFLDDSHQTFEVDKRSKAQHLLDKVFDHLELIEKDYFGLQFLDLAPDPDIARDKMRWLDPLKTIKKQCRGPGYEFFFRVKFYVTDPSKLTEEYTRYHFFLQVKKDILEGRLHCPHTTAALLASYAVQSELGDFNPDDHVDGYLSDLRFIPNQTDDFEKDVNKHHQSHRGQTPADAEFNYLDKAKRLEMYGVDLHKARVLPMFVDEVLPHRFGKDQSNLEIHLGVTSVGLVVFQNNMKINTFPWSKIVKISFKRKQFFIQLRREQVILGFPTAAKNDAVENLIGFNMVSYRSCKNMWKSCVEHHTFFRLHTPNPHQKKIFSIGSKFRYSGRTEFQTIEESKRRAKLERSFTRHSTSPVITHGLSYSQRRHDIRSPSKRYSRQTIGPCQRNMIIKNSIDGYKNAPISKSQTFSGVPQSPESGGFNRSDGQHPNHQRATLPHDYKMGSSSRTSLHSDKSNDEAGFLSTHNAKAYPAPFPVAGKMGHGKANGGPVTDSNHNNSNTNCDNLYNDVMPSSNGYLDGQGLVTIRMMPDDQGRFGFNVKGGADQGMPIIVSRVAPNTPADNADPRLNEGDQVLYINGRDVSQHTHEQVVKFIRLSRETRTKELNLIVRPNAYMTDDASDDQPEEFVYDPESYLITNNSGGNALDNSLHLLEESLESGAALAQFEQLYRKKPGMTMNVARSVANVPKNRYRDISPYDQTRVLIKSGPNGDYINANYVNMEIPVSGIVNRYIAAQGPLPTTCVDFWQMVWEQHSSLVVMLTTEVEKGRIKCHQYWPGLYETSDFGHLQITCVKEEKSPSFAFREFNLTNVESEEERHISHMQYISWPDHGVPDDPADFLDFVVKVRQKRVGVVEPSVVHCSAGIGRTGVLITMETAMCLIEANQPVFPLSIVRQMRDQRAMLIQTPNQYKFVCEAIIRCFSERIVEPLPEYQQR
ncbi:tyrosine-protein phosphatase non-receptor type 4-like isoform X5 [Mya arenaria]|uniref:tyrosine-protein phosphatase non-receptor type 4-like isoform X5 n=1 Tax=Mya arenaria TaxID=6604 RepID=UPI0022E4A803|nr:tyrosine-protein phosphatase non-receptor type 4-like isoform X5 [Mya arenaria]